MRAFIMSQKLLDELALLASLPLEERIEAFERSLEFMVDLAGCSRDEVSRHYRSGRGLSVVDRRRLLRLAGVVEAGGNVVFPAFLSFDERAHLGVRVHFFDLVDDHEQLLVIRLFGGE